ncbi:MAG TPA: dihydropteroate synthase, partial [Thermoanaerobaculia bacterium]|nr:dihydropteroate synthase [Thermoanaerobaculia bacterium]
MGILNVTPDSFSDGGIHFDHTKALHAALQMIEDGADMIDVGGESTRPGAAAISAEEEIERVIPVVDDIRRRSDITISIDTRKAKVARAAIAVGANMVNDVSGLSFDPDMRKITDVPLIVMHMRGEPSTMHQFTQYDDLVADVARELQERIHGLAPERIYIDPGIGFAKTAEQNLELLNRCHELTSIAPLVIGASRKSFIGKITGHAAGPLRMPGSLAAVAAAKRGGASIVRVHDVRETVDFLK